MAILPLRYFHFNRSIRLLWSMSYINKNENKYISTAPWGSELLRRRHNAHDLFLTELSKHEICTGTKQIHLSQATCLHVTA